jgi:hypothetical protein
MYVKHILLRELIRVELQNTSRDLQILGLQYTLCRVSIQVLKNKQRRCQEMDNTDQQVPELAEEKYEDIIKELTDIHEQIQIIHLQVEKLIIKTKETDKKLSNINKVEQIVRRYDSLTDQTVNGGNTTQATN